jgi:hypothetical protein
MSNLGSSNQTSANQPLIFLNSFARNVYDLASIFGVGWRPNSPIRIPIYKNPYYDINYIYSERLVVAGSQKYIVANLPDSVKFGPVQVNAGGTQMSVDSSSVKLLHNSQTLKYQSSIHMVDPDTVVLLMNYELTTAGKANALTVEYKQTLTYEVVSHPGRAASDYIAATVLIYAPYAAPYIGCKLAGYC